MSFVAAAIGGANALLGYSAANEAANAQVESSRAAQALQKQMFDKQIELQAPFREAGLTAQNRLLDLLGLSQNTGAAGYGSMAKNFGMSDFQADPGYAFRMSEGMKALERSAAARGNLLSGGTLKGIERYGQDLASNEYQNAFNRYQVNRSNILNPLQSLLGQSQTASNTLGNAAANYGNATSDLITGAGNARASGYMNAANAIAGGASQYLNYNQGNNLINALRGYGSGAGASGNYGNYGGGSIGWNTGAFNPDN